jgi:hypothetical protein
MTALPGPDLLASGGCGAVDRMGKARTWYVDTSPGKQHLAMLVGASLMLAVLIVIVVVAFAEFGIDPEGAM